MQQNKRIAINTLATYSQSLLALLIGLFSARWFLEALGAVDLGIFGVVGGIILLFSFVNTALTMGVSRFYCISIGESLDQSEQKKREELHRWFNTAFSAHISIALLILAIGLPMGECAIRNWLNIPDDRLAASVIVFRISIANAICEILSVPYIAMYYAHQAIAKIAVYRSFQSLLILALAWTLMHVEGDRLIFYAAGMAASSLSVTFLLVIRSLRCYPFCRPNRRLFFQREYLGKLLSYVGWKFFGTGCVVVRDGGIPVMLNLMFGPVMNAAFTITNRVSVQVSTLASSMQNAFQPAIVSAEGNGNRTQMLQMCMCVCRFGTLLVIVFAVPLAIEMDAVLRLWLKNPPPHTAELCQWILGLLILDRMTSGAMIAVNACGKIALYEIVQGSTFLIALPALWLFHKLGLGALSIGLALFLSVSLYCIGRLVFAKFLVSFPIAKWIKDVALPVVIIISISYLSGILINQHMTEGILRIISITAVTSISAFIAGFILLTSHEEKKQIKLILKGVIFSKIEDSDLNPDPNP